MFFQSFRDWRDRRAALRDVQTLDLREQSERAGLVSSPLHQATDALAGGDLGQAAKLWARARQVMPSQVTRSKETIDILLALGRLDELEALMLQGHKKSRRDKLYLTGLARVAERRGLFLEAAQWWTKLRSAFPADPDGWMAGAACLEKLGHNEERLAILQSARRYFPNDKDVWIWFARAQEAVGQWQQALQSWDYIGETLGHAVGYVGGASACERLGDLPGALERLSVARRSLTTMPR